MESQFSILKSQVRQSAQTGGVSSCEHSAGGPLSHPPLFSGEVPMRPGMSRAMASIVARAVVTHAPRANKSQVPEHLMRSGRIFLNGRRENAMYIGRNAGSVCEICGADATVTLDTNRPVWLQKFWLALARKRVHQKTGKEVPCMKQPQEYAAKAAKGYDRIAAVIAKSVAVQGDAFELDDAEALVMIMDILNDIDDSLIERNANKKLAPKRRR
jgi:hypothetical protein